MKNIYCISGLGADERIFKHLHVPQATFIHLPWLPFDEHETMQTYAAKMATQIHEQEPILIGLSFGGMLVSEISQQIPIRKGFLISSAKNKNELPDLSAIITFLLQHGLVPFNLFKIPNRVLFEKFGATTDDEKKLLSDILKDTQSDYLRAAFKVILQWNSTSMPQHSIHIHGTHDRIIDPTYVHPNYWIQDGSHMMIWNRSKEIADIITDHIY